MVSTPEIKWLGAEGQALDVLGTGMQATGEIMACIFNTGTLLRLIRIWPNDGIGEEIQFSWPEDMEFGDELRAYIEAQFKLLNKA